MKISRWISPQEIADAVAKSQIPFDPSKEYPLESDKQYENGYRSRGERD